MLIPLKLRNVSNRPPKQVYTPNLSGRIFASETFLILQLIFALDARIDCAYRMPVMENAGTRNIFAKTLAMTLIGAFALGACGIKGELQTPPPLWGDKDKQAEPSAETKPADEKQESNN